MVVFVFIDDRSGVVAPVVSAAVAVAVAVAGAGAAVAPLFPTAGVHTLLSPVFVAVCALLVV